MGELVSELMAERMNVHNRLTLRKSELAHRHWFERISTHMVTQANQANGINPETVKGKEDSGSINYQAFPNVIHGSSCIGNNWRSDCGIHIFFTSTPQWLSSILKHENH